MIFLNFRKIEPMKYLKIAAVLAFVSCGTNHVTYDYDEMQDFSVYKEYHIYPDLVSNLSELDEDRLKNVIHEEMLKKGFSETTSPGIYVNFYASQYQTPSNNSVGIGIGGGGGNMGVGVSGGIPIGGPETYLQLTFDFINVQNDALIWQAEVEGKYNKNSSPEKRTEQLQKMFQKALEGYPPKRK